MLRGSYAINPLDEVVTMTDPLTDAQVARALRLDYDLWDDAVFAEARVLTTPGANRRRLIARLDRAITIGDRDVELARAVALLAQATAEGAA